jgi:hypothetical protein
MDELIDYTQLESKHHRTHKQRPTRSSTLHMHPPCVLPPSISQIDTLTDKHRFNFSSMTTPRINSRRRTPFKLTIIALSLLPSYYYYSVDAYRSACIATTTVSRTTPTKQFTRVSSSLAAAAQQPIPTDLDELPVIATATTPTSTNTKTKNNNNNNAVTRTTSRTTNKKSKATKTASNKTNKMNRTSSRSSSLDDKALNQRIVQAPTATDLLLILQSLPGALTQPAGGTILNSVHLSTSLHRLAKHSLVDATVRASILADARVALLLAATAEVLVTPRGLAPRECSNVAWAVAKLKLVPPVSALPVATDTRHAVSTAATAVRQAVLQAAQQGTRDPSVWIPPVATLAGCLLDHVGSLVQSTLTTTTSTSTSNNKSFRQQEWANLLWAWATAGRADPHVFALVSERMRLLQQQGNTNDTPLRPQEWSNTLWAFATAQVYQGQEELLEYVATLFQDNADFVRDFKPQEMSNTVRTK